MKKRHILLSLALSSGLLNANSLLTYHFDGVGAGGIQVNGAFTIYADTAAQLNWDTAAGDFFGALDSFSLVISEIASSPSSVSYSKSDFSGHGVTGGLCQLERDSGVFTRFFINTREDLDSNRYEISGSASWQIPGNEFWIYENDFLPDSKGAPIAMFQILNPPILQSIPEPSSSAIIFGFAVTSVAILRRKRRSKP